MTFWRVRLDYESQGRTRTGTMSTSWRLQTTDGDLHDCTIRRDRHGHQRGRGWHVVTFSASSAGWGPANGQP